MSKKTVVFECVKCGHEWYSSSYDGKKCKNCKHDDHDNYKTTVYKD